MIDANALATRYLFVCNEKLGWNAVVDADGDLQFEVDRMVTYLQIDGSDPAYTRMRTGVRIGSYLVEQAGLTWNDPAVVARLERIATKVSRAMKCTKVAILPEQQAVSYSVEMLVASPDCMPDRGHLVGVLPRARRMLSATMREFSEELTLLLIESVTDATKSSDS